MTMKISFIRYLINNALLIYVVGAFVAFGSFRAYLTEAKNAWLIITPLLYFGVVTLAYYFTWKKLR